MWIRFSDVVQPVEFHERMAPFRLELGFHYEATVTPGEFSLLVAPWKGAHKLEGQFDYTAVVPCSRCLAPASMAGTCVFSLEFRPAGQAPVEEIVDLSGESDDITYYDEDTLQLEELMAQQMYLEMPEKILCREDCKGLCPRCGADLNRGLCACPPDPDMRWTPLAHFVSPRKE
jgi:uncharacterized protein